MRWVTLLARPRSWIGVLEVDAEVVAGIAVQPSPDADLEGQDVGEICSFYVHPRHWGERRGRAAVRPGPGGGRRARLPPVRLWVLEANVRARRIYAGDGWEPDGAAREVAPGVRELRYRAPHSVAAHRHRRRVRRRDGGAHRRRRAGARGPGRSGASASAAPPVPSPPP